VDRQRRKELLEAIGTVAIVASLVLVAYELRQNTLMMQAQISQTRADLAVSEQVATYNCDYIPGLLVKVDNEEALTDEEMVRYRICPFRRYRDSRPELSKHSSTKTLAPRRMQPAAPSQNQSNQMEEMVPIG